MRNVGPRGQQIPDPVTRALFTSSVSLLSSLKLSDTKVYEPYIRTLFGTASHTFAQ
jgi:hypothetical protein